MAERNTYGVGESGIPTGLNRIRTRIEPSNSGDSNTRNDTSVSRTRVKQNQRSLGKGLGKLQSSKEGLRKGKRIARWFSSHIFRDSSSSIDDNTSDTAYRNAKIKAFDKEGPSRKLHRVERPATRKQTSLLITSSNKMPEGFKAFSHELGPKGGIRPVPRAHSFSDLKELLRSFHSKFNAAKELVNTELACFKWEMMDLSERNDTLSPEGQKLIEDLLILAQECIEMSSIEFRTKCETIVQDLTDKRQLCQTGLLKWLLTRMLFILTRCTRVLHFEKQSEYVNEKSLNKLKECLEKLPSYEMGWLLNPGITDFDSGYALAPKCDTEYKLQDKNGARDFPKETRHRSELLVKESDPMLENDVMVTERHSSSDDHETGVLPKIRHIDDVDGNATSDSYKKQECGSLYEQQTSSDGHDLVICRICEELVPTSHLESHSYICAYADKCDIQTSDVNEGLLKLAEILEQIIDSRNLSTHATYDSPDSRTHVVSSASISEGCSPKVIEWRNKGVEGMFEDIHEMDTACIEDSSIISVVNPKGFNGPKLNYGGPPSATGSMTSASSTNTPRAGSFDFFWLEHNHPSELEDLQQMTDLMDIAHCAAGTDISEVGSHEFLLACMEDLQDILRNSKLKSLVIDTFGHRIENLLREKYIIACDLVDTNSGKSDVGLPRLLENAYQNSPVSTPSYSLHKERTSIEDFEIIKPISRGAYGKVFLARKRTTGDLFAIKVLKKMDMLRKNDIERIVAERNILITVRNPFVVRFFYSFTSRDNLYLVMEYLNGGDLFSLLRNVGCLSEDAARIYVAELVLALEYLHSLGIVHRDLKPDNILVAHDGHIKLTDFGLSKIGLMNSTGDMAGPETNGILHSDGRHDQLNVDRSERSAVGTPDYLAPEILLGTEHGYAADWWSVGVILFELIAGIPPFTADHPERIFDNILNMKIPWPPVPSDMSYEAQDLIRRFLVHDPNQRLGAQGASEVKEHSFFGGVNWNTLALQKAAFVPQPDGVDDTSYFVSRHNHSSSGVIDDQECSDDAASDTTELCSNTGLEKMDECGDLPDLESPHFDLSWINFSFKNLSQLASINHDVLVQNGKDSSRSSSPHKGPNL